MMLYFLCLSLIFFVSYGQGDGEIGNGNAVVTVHCDNHGKLSYQHNGGPIVVLAERPVDLPADQHLLWKEPLSGVVPNYCPLVKIFVECYDLHVVGGMIGQVRFRGVDYLTTNPLSNGYWSAVGSTDGIYDAASLVYTVNGQGAWGSVALDSGIDAAAYWVWNGQIVNSMFFEFDWPAIITYAKSEVPQIDGGGVKEVIVTSSSISNSLYGIIGFAAFMVFILINNIFICWYCLCHRKGGENSEKSRYESVKMIQEDDNA